MKNFEGGSLRGPKFFMLNFFACSFAPDLGPKLETELNMSSGVFRPRGPKKLKSESEKSQKKRKRVEIPTF